MPEKVFIYEEEYSKDRIKFLHRLKDVFLTSDNSATFVKRIYELKSELYEDSQKHVYIFISERTITWLRTNTVIARYVHRSEDWNILSLFNDTRLFESKYVIPGKIYVFHLID